MATLSPFHAPDLPGRDLITGVPNRALLLEVLGPLLALARRYGRGLALLHLRLGPGSGMDTARNGALLRRVAAIIQDQVRDSDVVARVDESAFAIALSEVYQPDAAVRVAHRLARELSGAGAGGGEIRCGIGAAFYPSDGLDATGLLAAAERATPRPGRMAFANEPLGRETLRRAGLLRDLQAPAALDEFELHYQPILALDTGAVVGAESLLRWNRSGALLPAAEFIDLADRSGRIRALERWSMERAMGDLVGWRGRGWPGWLSINVSPATLSDPELTGTVRSLLDETGAPAASLVFEVTERSALSGGAAERRGVDGLRELGARVAVDDFGSGYAGFHSLRHLDPDIVKLDRAFLTGGADPAADRLLPALVDLAHRLGKPVIAEGVEEPARLERSIDCACEMAQGYYLGRPVEATTFLTTHVQPRRTA